MSNNKYTICCIGHYGFNLDLLNGQTIKTKIVTQEIENAMGKNSVTRIDTHGGIKAIPRITKQLWTSIQKSLHIIVFLSDNGLRFIVPILWMMSLFVGKRHFHYVVIGGYIQNYLPTHHIITRILRKYDGIYVETRPMQYALKKMGFDNVIIMPNCKQLQITKSVKEYTKPIFQFCTFSRVMQSKGIEDAIKAIDRINQTTGIDICSLDIYGQIDEKEIEWFEHLISTSPKAIQYKGLVPFNESVNVLCKYHALLFPTYYEGEGFAGTIIDAFAAGLPIIASDWKYNASIIEHCQTGYIFPVHSIEGLINAIDYSCANPSIWNEMKKNCLEEAKKYQPNEVVKPLIQALSHGD